MTDQPNSELSSLRIQRDRGPSAAPHRTRNRIIKYVVIVVAVLLALYAAVSLVSPAPHVEVTSVTTMFPSQLNRVLVASGYVVAQRKAAVASKGTGRIVELNVVEGDKVRKDQILARLESGDIEAALQQARANLESIRAGLVQAKAEAQDATAIFERNTKLLKGGSISQAEFDVSDARYKRAMASITVAQANIRAAQAAVRTAEVQIENTVIRAPFDGTVLTKNADVGEVVAPFGAASNSKGAVVTIADMSSLEVEADVSEANIQKITPNHPCEITLDAFPDTRYRGVVAKIVPTADRAKATVLTKIRFVKLDGRVLPEMSAKVSFLAPDAARRQDDETPRTMVNANTVRTTNGRSVVFVLRDGVLHERQVTLGMRYDTMVEILSGVTAGEQVVIKPGTDFTNGMRVTLEKE
jgi:RND family efflux transporter MFP subunit